MLHHYHHDRGSGKCVLKIATNSSRTKAEKYYSSGQFFNWPKQKNVCLKRTINRGRDLEKGGIKVPNGIN